MKMAVMHMQGSAGKRVIQALTERGLLVSVISLEGGKSRPRRTSAVAAVTDDAIQLLYEVIQAHGGAVVSMANPLLPLVDPAEYHVSSPIPSNEGGVTVYLMRLRRYERIR
jgi:uncharacterized protein YaaQ